MKMRNSSSSSPSSQHQSPSTKKKSSLSKLFSTKTSSTTTTTNSNNNDGENTDNIMALDGIHDPRSEMRAMILQQQTMKNQREQLLHEMMQSEQQHHTYQQRRQHGSSDNNDNYGDSSGGGDGGSAARRGSAGSVSTLTKSITGGGRGVSDETSTQTSEQQQQHPTAAAAVIDTAAPYVNSYKHDNETEGGDNNIPYTKPSGPSHHRLLHNRQHDNNNNSMRIQSSNRHSNNRYMIDDNDDDDDGHCAIDVNATRAELLSKLTNTATSLKCSTVEEDEEESRRQQRRRRSSNSPTPSSLKSAVSKPPSKIAAASKVAASSTTQAELFKVSLTEYLIDMGFNTDDITKAMIACNATQSEDAADVIEWLGDHTSSSMGNGISNSGGGSGDVDQTSTNVVRLSNDIDNSAAESTNNNQEEEDDDDEEEVQILTESLRELGFDEGEIRHKKQLYRRASKNSEICPEDFIAAMFEVEEEEGENNDDHDSPQRTLSEPIVTHRDSERRDELNRSASVTHGRKKRSNESNDDDDDSELFSFLSAMGFSIEQIESAVDCIRREKGRKDIDADDVVAVLLSSQSTEEGEEELQQQSPRKESKGAKSTTALLPLQPAKPDSPYEIIDDQQSSNDNEFMKIEVTPGNFAPVLKGCLTTQAIRDGTALSAHCSICNVLLDCCPEAEYVLCPDCDVVSPIWRNRDDVLEQSHHQQRHHGRRGSVTSDGSSSHRSARSHRRMTTGGMIGAIGLGHKVKHNPGQR
jgi:Holliday junction resolvasome RuvABC DNA-binding subunit